MAGRALTEVNPIGRAELPQTGEINSIPPILIVPGLSNSGPDHWQRRWLSTLPGASLVDQADWSRPVLCEWIARLIAAIRQRPGAILVGHSLGAVLIAYVTAFPEASFISGALLVAPADVDSDGPEHDRLRPFSPVPGSRLPFPTIVAASRNDPFVAFGRAQTFASSWGARLVDAGAAGHINVALGHGPWPLGEDLLARLRAEVQGTRNEEVVATSGPSGGGAAN